MPYRKILFAKDEVYHVFSRGVASLPIFSSLRDYFRFVDLIDYYRFVDTPMSYSNLIKLPIKERSSLLAHLRTGAKCNIEILAFCLMPNHFHFLLRQINDKGIRVFLSNLQNSYAKYFNAKSNRTGPLFEPMFKAVRIETDEQLLHVSRYIHLNPSTGYLVEPDKLVKYRWSSLPTFLNMGVPYGFVNSKAILNFFKESKTYESFLLDHAEYQRSLGKIKHLVFE